MVCRPRFGGRSAHGTAPKYSPPNDHLPPTRNEGGPVDARSAQAGFGARAIIPASTTDGHPSITGKGGPRPMRRIAELDALRGIAAIVIVVFHLRFVDGAPVLGTAVDLFFV